MSLERELRRRVELIARTQRTGLPWGMVVRSPEKPENLGEREQDRRR